MKILLNGAWLELPSTAPPAATARPTLAALLQACGYGVATVATAVNGEFVPAQGRAEMSLSDGDRVEVLAPMQGG
jgi:sulfur carrier protein